MTNDLRHTIRLCLSGSQTAMLELVNQFQGRVFGLCYRMLGQRQDAEDMTQETFARALRNLHRWDPERKFEPWLLAIAGNRCRTLLSKRMRKPPMNSLDQPVPDRPNRQHPSEFNPLEEEVQRALDRVRAEYREAFVLFHEHELSYADISQALEVPLGTVKTWVHRARREIIQQLLRRGVVEEPRHELRHV